VRGSCTVIDAESGGREWMDAEASRIFGRSFCSMRGRSARKDERGRGRGTWVYKDIVDGWTVIDMYGGVTLMLRCLI